MDYGLKVLREMNLGTKTGPAGSFCQIFQMNSSPSESQVRTESSKIGTKAFFRGYCLRRNSGLGIAWVRLPES
jgi:hypothetical protein